MKTISVWAPKGGVGKSTVALTLAGGLAMAGRRVWLVDADQQSTCLAWAALAQRAGQPPAFVVSSAAPRRAADFDYIVHDCAPTAQPASLAGDAIIVPLLLDAASYIPTATAAARLEAEGRQVVRMVNRLRRDRAEQRALLGSLPTDPIVLADRAAFARAYSAGLTIWDLTGPGVAWARDEAQRLIDNIEPGAGRWRVAA